MSSDYFEKPITKIEDDKFGFCKLARNVANAIVRMPIHESYTFSINGEWGSGKTSFINLIKYFLNDFRDNHGEKLIIINFDTSLFQNATEMIGEFYKQVLTILKKDKKLKKNHEIKNIISTISEYASFVCETLEPISKINLSTKIGNSIFSFINQKVDKTDSLMKKKETLEKILSESDYRFIVIIDDIDRLQKDQAKQVFQLIYSIGKLPNHFYILPFDKKIVSKAINDVYGLENGNEYLEKIIQKEIEVPFISEDKLKELLFSKLQENGLLIDESENNYIDFGYRVCLKPFLRTIRDIFRLCDNFSMTSKLTIDYINQFDLLILTSIKLYFPNLYRYISDNKTRLITKNERFAENEQPESLTTELSVYEISNIEDYNKAKAILDFLFPNFHTVYHGNKESYSAVEYPEHKRHISNPNYLFSYFTNELGTVYLSKKEMTTILTQKKYNEMIDIFGKLNKNNSYIFQQISNEINSFIKNEELSESQIIEISKVFGFIYDENEHGIINNPSVEPYFQVFCSCLNKIDYCWKKYFNFILNSEENEDISVKMIKCLARFMFGITDLVGANEISIDQVDYDNFCIAIILKCKKIPDLRLFDGLQPNYLFGLWQRLHGQDSNLDIDIDSVINAKLVLKTNMFSFLSLFRSVWNQYPDGTQVSVMRSQKFPNLTNLDSFALTYVDEYLKKYNPEQGDDELYSTMDSFRKKFV